MQPEISDGYPVLDNKPMSCTRCGNVVTGKVLPIRRSDRTTRLEIKWVCGRCGTLLRIGTARQA